MTFYRGTQVEFDTWHAIAMSGEGITLPEGKVSIVNGVPDPSIQKTMAYSRAISHPTNEDDYVWAYGDYTDGEKTSLSFSECEALGWFQAE